MTGFYTKGHYELAGFSVVAAARKRPIPGPPVNAADQVIGPLPSGFHTNGHSRAPPVLFATLSLPSTPARVSPPHPPPLRRAPLAPSDHHCDP